MTSQGRAREFPRHRDRERTDCAPQKHGGPDMQVDLGSVTDPRPRRDHKRQNDAPTHWITINKANRRSVST